ncbi:MAG: glucans biosynthesis glucosyltransferase MdoH [Vicinamibacterales bacterium]
MPVPKPPQHSASIRLPLPRLRRWLFFGPLAGTAVVGIGMMLDIVWDNGITVLGIVILTLFAATFSWICVPFWNAVIGFVLRVLRRDPLSLEKVRAVLNRDGPIVSRTALVMPVHNEDPARVMGGLAVMLRSLARTGHVDQFDVFLLSDTTDPAIVRAEETAWMTLRRQLDRPAGLYYRRREANVGRKAGNIRDFCERWGSHYEFMVVLDADSLMTGSALVELVRTMEANPRAGLMQTVPIPVRRTTLFGRLLQFAASLYSTMLATGQSFWQADAANYWGHNAIIRVEAFADHCRLPVLPGSPPLGGAILSHDFVEAALMRRAGWQVFLLPGIGGSYEEVPGNIVDYATRDRRWSQGSLQHLRLLGVPGLHPLSRLHFVLGAMGYVSSVLWLLMLLASTAYIALPSLRTAALLNGHQLAPIGFIPSASEIVPLLAVTILLLFVPKLLALILALVRERQPYGGSGRLLISAVLEMVFAVVVAPLMMMYHTRFVLSVLSGHDITWEPQVREERPVGWSESWRKTAGTTGVGLTWASVTLYFSPTFFWWLTPIFAGLLCAAPLVRWTNSRALGQWTRHRGLFLVPSETASSPELLGSSRAGQGRPSEPIPEAVALSVVSAEQPDAIPAPLLGRRPGPTSADGVSLSAGQEHHGGHLYAVRDLSSHDPRRVP